MYQLYGSHAFPRHQLYDKKPGEPDISHMQVRAGTGGDEAALFAGDLLRMYERAAALHGWRFEVCTSICTYSNPNHHHDILLMPCSICMLGCTL